MNKKLLVVVLLFMVLSSITYGLKIGGKILPDQIKAGENTLI